LYNIGDSQSVTTDLFSVQLTHASSAFEPHPTPHLYDIPLDEILSVLENLKADNIVSLNVSQKSCYTDYIVIASGTSHRHLISIADKLAKELRHKGYDIPATEQGNGDWILLDLGNIIIHLLKQELRDLYGFERMWAMNSHSTPTLELSL